ncbi:hypothetical protein A2841_01775 [Candidatus Kaiserbacteria bacterium RIFCSPHIGHO2_01_FULL_48_10]|uniref:Methyltransferase type 11 domain-containing protein n=1 Tax=Candidatus Kaiserbacteria bacterium RIFCSPHIGHO2_01_FULL_48_10 TaxID=1798476 RepID=A0A1F6C635_9BACT|nr:MAG: hypothetical protein A2841_01775 [Candidatus Kaiserbacteria bacterium RIFCSPHIGHO2_01_FULL_48_10]
MISPEKREAQRMFWTRGRNAADYHWQQTKVNGVQKYLKGFDRASMIGDVVVDVGGGQRPVSFFLRKPGRKILSIDFVKPKIGNGDIKHLKGDIREISNLKSFARRKALLKTAEWLGVDSRSASPQQIDTLIFSDVLNYVPYEATIRAFAPHLKENGTLIVLNQPGRGFGGLEDFLFDDLGVKHTPKMIRTIERIGFRRVITVIVTGKEQTVPENGQYMTFSAFQKTSSWLKRKYYGLHPKYRPIGKVPQ